MKFDVVGMVNRCTFFLKQHAPEILVVGGAAGTIVGGVMACVATTHLPEVHEKAHARMEVIREQSAEDERKAAMTKAYIQTGFEYVKLYAPSVIVGGLSITSILAGNNILRKRNVALAAAYATLDSSYKKYRGRVASRFGEDVEREIYHDIQKKTIKETVTDENGNEVEVEKTIEVAGELDEYSRYFEKGKTRAAEDSHEYNMFFLTLQERLANDQLRAHGYLFLNDVFQMLGYDRTKVGAVTGWVYDPENADKYQNDNHVNFHIQPIYRIDENTGDEYVETILLSFNVDGPILDHGVEKNVL